MPISNIPLFSMLRTKMQWHQERQRVLAENVSNADTPKFRPRDLAPVKFEGNTSQVQGAPPVSGGLTLATTAPGHIGASAGTAAPFPASRAGNYEIRPAGNAVNLE